VRPVQAEQPAQAPAATPSGVPSGEAASAALQPPNAAPPVTAPETPLLAAGVEMQEMIDSLRGTIELAARQGISHARIALQPEELGHVRIELIKRGDGLIARVSAETPEAAQALLGGRAELAHSLRGLGGTLLSLDIGSSGDFQAHGQGAGGAGADGARTAAPAAETDEGEQSTAAPAMLDGDGTVTQSAKGALVDVLA